MRWVAAEIAEAVGGVVRGDPAVTIDRATQDSREVDGDDWLFVPLVADRDGHDFVAAATERGARLTLASQPVEPGPATVIEVADTGAALLALGRASRNRLPDSQVVGITGSVGKTTTKDLLGAVLAGHGSVHASVRSFNNEIGLPLTLVNTVEGEADHVVLEMGARGLGHIAMLCDIGRPTVGVVTTVGSAHTSEFGSVEAVAQGKGELIAALPSDGSAVLNADVPLVAAMAERTAATVLTFGAAGEVRAEAVELSDDLVPRFRLVTPWGSAPVELGARGDARGSAMSRLVSQPVARAVEGVAAGTFPPGVQAAPSDKDAVDAFIALVRENAQHVDRVDRLG